MGAAISTKQVLMSLIRYENIFAADDPPRQTLR